MSVDAHVMLETRRTDLPVIKEWIDNHDYGNAGKALTAYLNENPTCDEGLFLYGRLMLEQDSAAISAIIYERLTAADKEQRWENYVNLGKAWDHQNEPYKAEYCYKKALEIEPDNQRVFTGYLNALLVKAIRLFHRKKFDEAENIFRFILEHRQDSILAHLYLGRIYRLTGQDSRSLDHYDTAARLSPGDPVFPMMKAFILLRTGDVQSAFQELDRVKELFGGSPG